MTFADNSFIAFIKYQVRLSGFTVLIPVDFVITHSGKTVSNSCAITPNCKPSLLTTADFTTSANSGLSIIISSSVLYSKFFTWILFRASKPTVLLTIFFLILLSEVVDQLELLLP